MTSTKSVFIEGNILRTDYSFNEPFDDAHYEMMSQVEHIVFGHSFNQEFNIPPNILSIKFDDRYNKPIVLTHGLVALTFGREFDQRLELGPDTRRLILGNDRQYCTVILNKNLVFLECCLWQSYPFRSSKYLEQMNYLSGSNLIILNRCMEIIWFGDGFNRSIDLSKNVAKIRFGRCFTQSVFLNKKMRDAIFGYGFNCDIKLPKHLKYISFWGNIRPTILTPNIEILHLTHSGCGSVWVEHSNACLWISNCMYNFGKDYSALEWLPQGLKCVKTSRMEKKFLNNLPNDVNIRSFDAGDLKSRGLR